MSRLVRRLGWLLVGIGVFLVCFLSYIIVTLYPSFFHPGQDMPDGRRFTGTADQAAQFLKILMLVVGFGAVSIVTGVWQIVTGRRSLTLFAVAMLLAATLVISALAITGGRAR